MTKDFLDDPEHVKQLEQIMLDEDAGKLQGKPLNVHLEVTPLSLEAQRDAHERAITLLQKVHERYEAITSIVPPQLRRHSAVTTSASFGSLAVIYEVSSVRLYIEIFSNLSVKVRTSYKELDSNMEPRLISESHLFDRQIFISVIHEYIRPFLVKLQGALLDGKIADTGVLTSRDLKAMKAKLDADEPLSDGEFAAVQKALFRYYNKRKKQTRARTGRRS